MRPKCEISNTFHSEDPSGLTSEVQWLELTCLKICHIMQQCILQCFLFINDVFTFVTDRDGDVYAAMRDCHTALQLDPDHMKAHFR